MSAGYDAHAADPLAELDVTDAGYEAVATALGAVVARLGLPGVALTLEGGYDLEALRASVAATIRGLLAGSGIGPDPGYTRAGSEQGGDRGEAHAHRIETERR